MSLYATPAESREAGVAYHLLAAEVWEHARSGGTYTPDRFAEDGFIHCTNGLEELVAVANRYYRDDARPYVALALDLTRVTSPVRYDDPDQIYPHIYGSLNLSAVIDVLRAERSPDGTFLAFHRA